MTHGHRARRLLRPLRRRHQRRPVPDLRAPPRGGAGLPQRALRLLGAVPPRRRREGAGQLAGLLEHPQRHPRHHQGRRRPAARGDPVRGPAGPHHAPRASCPGSSRPRRMAALEDQVRALLRPAASTRSSGPTGSTSSTSSPSVLPMRVIGMLLGIPEQDQVAVRNKTDDNLRTVPGQPMQVKQENVASGDMFADYIDWRAEHPSDDLMTQLLNAEFEDETGETRTLTRQEVLTYTAVIAGAGNETTGRLIGWLAKLLAEHPDQRRAGRRGPLADPQRDRRDAAVRADRARHRPLRHARTSSTTARPSPPAAPILLLARRRPTATPAATPTPTSSTSTATTSSTSPSATASTSASAPASPGSRAASPSTSCSTGSPSGTSTTTACGSPRPRRSAAGSACPSCSRAGDRQPDGRHPRDRRRRRASPPSTTRRPTSRRQPSSSRCSTLLDQLEDGPGCAGRSCFRSADPDFFIMHGDVTLVREVEVPPPTNRRRARTSPRRPSPGCAPAASSRSGCSTASPAAVGARSSAPSTCASARSGRSSGSPRSSLGIIRRGRRNRPLARDRRSRPALDILLTGRDVAADELLRDRLARSPRPVARARGDRARRRPAHRGRCPPDAVAATKRVVDAPRDQALRASRATRSRELLGNRRPPRPHDALPRRPAARTASTRSTRMQVDPRRRARALTDAGARDPERVHRGTRP